MVGAFGRCHRWACRCGVSAAGRSLTAVQTPKIAGCARFGEVSYRVRGRSRQSPWFWAQLAITVDLAGEEMQFLLGSREVAGDTDLDVYSEMSPLGAAIVGHKVGDSASYTAPNGREISVKILDATPFKV